MRSAARSIRAALFVCYQGDSTMKKFNALLTWLGLVCLGIAAGLIVMELALRLIPRQQLDAMMEKSTRLQLYQFDPEIGWRLRPDAHYVHTTREDVPIQVETNSLGLRDEEHLYRKPSGLYRILILGDSFTEALDVTLKESFPFRLEQCLNQKLATPIEVINGGVSGYGPIEQYLFYMDEGIKYQPDLVLLATYVGNDLNDLDSAADSRATRAFGGYRVTLAENGRLVWHWQNWENGYGAPISPVQLFLRQHSRLYRLLAHPESKIYGQYAELVEKLRHRLRPEAPEPAPPPWYVYRHYQHFADNPLVPAKMQQIWAIFQALIAQLHARVNTADSQMAAVIIPTEYQVYPDILEATLEDFAASYQIQSISSHWDIDEPDRTLMSYFESQQIPALDLLPYFREHDRLGGSSLYFEGDFPQHLNRDGQKLTGDVLCDWLVRNEAIKLPRP